MTVVKLIYKRGNRKTIRTIKVNVLAFEQNLRVTRKCLWDLISKYL